jgi:cytochrome b561
MTPVGKYTKIAVLLHWLIALLITFNIILGLGANYVPDADVRPMIDLHKSFGITILTLAFIRFFWRFTHTPPPFPPNYAVWERYLAHTAHVLLYVLIFALPITGWIHDSAWSAAASHPLLLFWVIPWFRPRYQGYGAHAVRPDPHAAGLCAVRRPRPAHPGRAETPVLR